MLSTSNYELSSEKSISLYIEARAFLITCCVARDSVRSKIDCNQTSNLLRSKTFLISCAKANFVLIINQSFIIILKVAEMGVNTRLIYNVYRLEQ